MNELEFSLGAAIGTGLVATLVMTAVMYMGRAMMPAQMPMNILFMFGSMMTKNTGPAYLIGIMIHAMNGVIFAIIHTALFNAFELQDGLVGWGVLFGFGHWLIAGMTMGMVGGMHPRIKAGELDDPGLFAKNLPTMNMMGFLMVHIIYGVVVGALYQAWA